MLPGGRVPKFVFQIWRFWCCGPGAPIWAAFFARGACRSVYRGCWQCACVWKFSNRVSGNLVRPTKLPRQAIYSAAHEVPRPRVRIRPTPRVPEALGSRQEAVLKYLLRNRGLPILVWKRKK